ncbi:FtsX-like permease family protein [Alteromonas sp. KUL49]|uniref:FtsX-like permease family protein n=1 Tax=Alteromonas sp. KUL49 TaxID=2480798 RepID=UPI00102EF8BE|nr:FtsX-like permease family protein [Alteromonas sp. KUL49]TAP38680.1 FtsX-like permease family protein [Alteromonas sp. KUL49]GEA12629.1 hypothetical protein KUL49_30040 [Alteromonas sp. KUL49]
MRLHISAFKQGISRIFTLPRLSLPLIVTLGLTLAAVLTVVAIANTLLFKPLPDINEENLYQVDLQMAFNEGLTVPFFSDPRRVASAKARFGDALSWGYISPGGGIATINNTDVTVTYFSAASGSPEVLGLTLITGQGSNIDNAEEGVWISKSLWQSAYGEITDMSQQTIRLEGADYPIFGVFDDLTSMNQVSLSGQLLEQVWQFEPLEQTLAEPDAIVLNLGPITFVRGPTNRLPTASDLEQWFVDYVNTDITIDRAREFLLSKPVSGQVIGYRDAFIGDSQQLVFVLLFAMLSLLIMACLNLLNMFIAHYQSRGKEFAIQICMGSSIAKLRSLVFTENLPMFLMATVLGLLTAGWLIKVLPTIAGDNLPLLDQISVDATSVLIALVAITLINVVFAAIALVYVDKSSLTDSLNSSGKGTPAQQKPTISKVLMIVQLTLACVLLTGASVSVKDSYNNTYTDLGYNMPNAYEVSMEVSDEVWQASLEGYEQYRGSEWQQLRSDFVQRLSSLNAEIYDINTLPLTSNVSMSAYPDPDTGNTVMIRPMMWAENMFSRFDITLLAGRDLTAQDVDTPAILIAKSFAVDRAGEGGWESMVGQELKMGDEPDDIFKVVGIVEDTYPMPTGALNVDAPEIYFPSPTRINFDELSAVVIMPEGETLELDTVEGLLNGMDSRLTELQVESMIERWDTVTEATRLNMYVVTGLAILTLVLAAIGVSGLSQMTASQKRYELAVRMATGAKRSRLLRLLVNDSMWMLLVGLGFGVIAAVGAYEYFVGFFESAPAFDWLVTFVINLVLAIVMLVSIALPGWVVIRKDPMRVLREL